MPKRIPTTHSTDGPIAPDEVRKLLDALCVECGFCSISKLWRARLERNPPRSIAKFTDTVFRAEGLDPLMVDSHLYKSIRAQVAQAFKRSRENGAL